jgi:hypothetical protein
LPPRPHSSRIHLFHVISLRLLKMLKEHGIEEQLLAANHCRHALYGMLSTRDPTQAHLTNMGLICQLGERSLQHSPSGTDVPDPCKIWHPRVNDLCHQMFVWWQLDQDIGWFPKKGALRTQLGLSKETQCEMGAVLFILVTVEIFWANLSHYIWFDFLIVKCNIITYMPLN